MLLLYGFKFHTSLKTRFIPSPPSQIQNPDAVIGDGGGLFGFLQILKVIFDCTPDSESVKHAHGEL